MGKVTVTKDRSDNAQLAKLERLITKNQKAAWYQNALIMRKIRDEKLWKGKYKSFEDYLLRRWEFSTSHGHRLMESVEIVQRIGQKIPQMLIENGRNSSPIGDVLPSFESQVRPLITDLSTDSERVKVWSDVVLSLKGKEKITAALVQKKVDEFLASGETVVDMEFDEISNTYIDSLRRKEIKLEEVKAAAALPSDKFRVFYADPPWKYGDGLTESYGGTQFHYPSMTIRELRDMPVESKAQDDAVLFLWVTSPLLEECFPIIKAWGFKYKSSFVWDKIKHNMGHYNSVRHEFLLICTRGSCVPDVSKLFDSVQSIERTSHSAKPEEFRVIIDTIYPYGPRLELFRRGAAMEGWQAWGNEVVEP